MTWLLRLYPRAWRRRYGAELEEVIASQPKSLQLAVDLVGGAIDARLNGRELAQRFESAAAVGKRGSDMVTRLLSCERNAGPSTREALAGGVLTIVVTLVLLVVWRSMQLTLGEHPAVHGMLLLAFPGSMVVGMWPTYLRGHSVPAKVAFVGGQLALLFAIGFLAGLF